MYPVTRRPPIGRGNSVVVVPLRNRRGEREKEGEIKREIYIYIHTSPSLKRVVRSLLFFDTRLFHIHNYYNPSRSPFSIITSPPPPLANGHKRSGRWTQINIHIDTECIATGATRNSTDPEKLELVPVSSSFFPLPLLSNELERKKFYLFLFLAQNSR